ncbi:hypothetical protein OG601_47225 [Streptomyces sp. NBC_01239]|uniref:hypothetical protein n=1 Tax=Streptomyces sp. NBC_01239 TaxID=2903792 RepID=UPI00224F877C|nr:hypothetical protein [Streptomyces sp. NBC_01239]MCX4809015.1 hypothetical protein [Streptomyces sp. NBC_01239]MCX4816719.1 hypothetical protein [Streptomyces sp. NBC_01239]MCX4818167.1 hypothetical protein [Streptomyces sp. NBC_01239]
MTDRLQPVVVALNDALDTFSDPVDEFEAIERVEELIGETLRGRRRSVAIRLYDGGARTYREVGQIMGGVTASRAEQIVKGR